MTDTNALTRRERQILNVLYKKGSARASEVREELEVHPSYSTVRTLLGVE